MSGIHSIPLHVSANRADMLTVFIEHLIEVFQMPAEKALERINRELGANPLTREFQLQLTPGDGPSACQGTARVLEALPATLKPAAARASTSSIPPRATTRSSRIRRR